MLRADGVDHSGADVHRNPIELALNRILRAALVKPEYFVRQIQSICHKGEPLVETVAPLDVYLSVQIDGPRLAPSARAPACVIQYRG